MDIKDLYFPPDLFSLDLWLLRSEVNRTVTKKAIYIVEI